MLILSRKKNERIIINDIISISIIEIKGDQVKLGIEAPEYVKVFRHEIYEAILEENAKAVASEAVILPELKIKN
ncbi:MAG: carbon storage regulator CsrA [Spirochaetaceae bacterium]|nr:carbon storage regulator CsrA [Spirochaetaceae bacterium]